MLNPIAGADCSPGLGIVHGVISGLLAHVAFPESKLDYITGVVSNLVSCDIVSMPLEEVEWVFEIFNELNFLGYSLADARSLLLGSFNEVLGSLVRVWGCQAQGRFLETLYRWSDDAAFGLRYGFYSTALGECLIDLAVGVARLSGQEFTNYELEDLLMGVDFESVFSEVDYRAAFRKVLSDKFCEYFEAGSEQLNTWGRMVEVLFDTKTVSFFELNEMLNFRLQLFLHTNHGSVFRRGKTVVAVADTLETLMISHRASESVHKPASSFIFDDGRFEVWETGASLWLNATEGGCFKTFTPGGLLKQPK